MANFETDSGSIEQPIIDNVPSRGKLSDKQIRSWSDSVVAHSKYLDQKINIVKEDYINKLDKLNESNKQDAFRTIEIIGIFASLLAFVAFEAQIFKGPLSIGSLVGVSGLMLGGLMMFVVLLSIIFGSPNSNISHWRWLTFAFSCFCIAGGGYVAYTGYMENDYATDTEVDSRIEEINNDTSVLDERLKSLENNNELLDFKECVKTTWLSNCL